MDESGNGNPNDPLIVGGVAADREFSRLDSDIVDLFAQWNAQGMRLGGLDSFKQFKAKGFHGGQMPQEIQFAFLDFLSRRMDFKTFMIYSNRTRMKDITEDQRLVVMYTLLLTDLIVRFKNYTHLIILVEENETLRPYLAQLQEKALTHARAKSAARIHVTVEANMVPKNQPVTLSVIDYYMLIVARWLRDGELRDGTRAPYRNLAAIEHSISFLRSFEEGVKSNRSARITS